MNDLKSISQLSSGQYTDRGSKFYSFIHPLDSTSDYKDLIRQYKNENPKACHVCSAYRIYLKREVSSPGTDVLTESSTPTITGHYTFNDSIEIRLGSDADATLGNRLKIKSNI